MPEDGAADGGLEGGGGSPHDALLQGLGSGGEGWQWEAVPNLDQFFTRIYRWVLPPVMCVVSVGGVGKRGQGKVTAAAAAQVLHGRAAEGGCP